MISILCAYSIRDCYRYFAVTQVQYIHSRTTRTIGTMITMIWLTSVVVSLAPLFGWKDPDSEFRVTVEKQCLVSYLFSRGTYKTKKRGLLFDAVIPLGVSSTSISSRDSKCQCNVSLEMCCTRSLKIRLYITVYICYSNIHTVVIAIKRCLGH